MSDPARSGERAQLLNLLDRLDAVDRARVPRPFLPEVIIDNSRRSRGAANHRRRSRPPAQTEEVELTRYRGTYERA
jgi:hypothetical protein